jgi:uncharacterized membrane protein YdjX (TVP38/TMEM64 family)
MAFVRSGIALSANIRIAAFAGAALALAVAAASLPLAEWLIAGVGWIQAHRAAAWPLFVLSYVAATVLLVPGTILTLAAGFVFGLPVGVALVSLSSVAGATCAFLIGRYFARDWVQQRIAKMPRFDALDRATHHDGFLIVLLVRLSPLFPFNVSNYGLSITAARLRDYVLASWIGMLPGTVLYVYIGTLVLDIAELASGGIANLSAQRYLLVGGFVATVALTVLITHRATRALRRQLSAEAADDSDGDAAR